MAKETIPADVQKAIKDAFKDLKDDVAVEVYTRKGVNDSFNDLTTELISTIAKLSPKIRPGFFSLDDEQASRRGVTRSPTVLVEPDRYRIRFTGAPLGEEGRSLLLSIIMASTRGVAIMPDSLARLQELKEPRHVQVYVSPT